MHVLRVLSIIRLMCNLQPVKLMWSSGFYSVLLWRFPRAQYSHLWVPQSMAQMGNELNLPHLSGVIGPEFHLQMNHLENWQYFCSFEGTFYVCNFSRTRKQSKKKQSGPRKYYIFPGEQDEEREIYFKAKLYFPCYISTNHIFIYRLVVRL